MVCKSYALGHILSAQLIFSAEYFIVKVKDLIKALQSMPQDARVLQLWDGEARTAIKHVWLSRSGDVITADNGEFCHSTETRPIDAPTEQEYKLWKTPGGEYD